MPAANIHAWARDTGRFEAYGERHINARDVVAGLAIARGAGAATSDFMTGDWLAEGNEILAATPALYEPLRARCSGVIEQKWENRDHEVGAAMH